MSTTEPVVPAPEPDPTPEPTPIDIPTPVPVSSPPKPPIYKRTGFIIAAAALVVVILGGIIGISWYNGVRNKLIDQENGLNAQYQANQADLDTYVKTVTEQFSISQAKAGALDKVILDAVKGRYDKNLTAVTPGSASATNPLISALREAYPDLGGLNVYDRLLDSIAGGRKDFEKLQTKLLDELRPYESYREKGIIHKWMVGKVGYPALEARIGKKVYKGKAALEQMHLIVTSTATNSDFQSGTEGPIKFGG